MALTGKSSLSLRKKDLENEKSIALGFKKVVFAHKATAGDTGINLQSLVTPTEMSSAGFTNPTSSALAGAQLLVYRNNLKLISSEKGLLMDFLSYNIAGSMQINFNGWTASDGEIFTGIIDEAPVTGNQIVDGNAIVSTGALAAGTTDYNVGSPFEVGKYISSQVGAVVVYRNGLQQFRNTGNSSSVLDGNYYEVDPGGGLATLIRFNDAAGVNDDSILVTSNGILTEKPTGSTIATLETLAGQIDAMVPSLAAAIGVPESTFQAAPNNVDLKQFGDAVLLLQQQMAVLSQYRGQTAVLREERASGVSVTSTTSYSSRIFNTLNDPFGIIKNPGVFTGTGSTNTEFNLDAGTYRISGTIYQSGSANGRARLYNVTDASVVFTGMNTFSTTGSQTSAAIGGTITISAGKVFRIEMIASVASAGVWGSPRGDGTNEVYSIIEVTRLS